MDSQDIADQRHHLRPITANRVHTQATVRDATVSSASSGACALAAGLLLTPATIIALQRCVGNAAVHQALTSPTGGRLPLQRFEKPASVPGMGSSTTPSTFAFRGQGNLWVVSADKPLPVAHPKHVVPALQGTVWPVLQRSAAEEGAPGSRPHLNVADSGPGVALLQRMLGATETGVFDQQTREAVDRFQRQQGWEPSGVGPETWRRLDGHAGAPGHRPNLVEGDRGPGVRLLQRILGIQETGFFGSATREAVDAFQRQQGWEPTGVGRETWKRLDNKNRDKVDRICKAKSFTKKFGNWDISWPAFYGSSTTVRLPIKFTLELEEGSSKEDCHIYQQKKGLTSTKCEKEDESPNFEKDGPTWWDGKDWRGAGRRVGPEQQPRSRTSRASIE